MANNKETKKTNIIDDTTATVENLLNSSTVKSSHHHHRDRTPLFNEQVSRDKKQKKQEIKDAQNTKKKSIGSLILNTTKKLGVTHTPEDKESLALLCDQMHFDAKEAYKLLRTNIMFCLPDNTTCRTIGITSAIRGEGKSTCAINLAYTFAVANHNVLLIDMDMRLPSIARKLNIESNLGLSDYLIGNATLKQIIRTTDKYKNWDVMLSGSIPPAPSELISSDNMKSLLNTLKKKYDFIIIDLPPVNVVSDALVAKDILDGYVLAVRQDYSDKRSLNNCIRQLTFLDVNILGFAMTDAEGGSGYYKKYGKRYGRYYRRYYRRYGYRNKYGYDYGYYGDSSKKDSKQ